MCGVHKQQGPIAQRANYIQHPVINHNGKKEKITCMYDLVKKKKKRGNSFIPPQVTKLTE